VYSDNSHQLSRFKSCSNRLVDLRFDVEPQPKNFTVRKRQDLCADDAPNSLLTVAPPPAVGQTSLKSQWLSRMQGSNIAYPESSRFRSSSRPSVRQHERQSPSLWRITLYWIYLGDGIGQVRLRIRNALSSEVWKLLDLIGEHQVDSLFLEDLCSCRWRCPIIEECCNDFCAD
jgi:hypothetical protein